MQGAMKQFKDYQCIWDDNDDGLVFFIDIWRGIPKMFNIYEKAIQTGLSM